MARKAQNPAERQYDRTMKFIANQPMSAPCWSAMVSAGDNVALTEKENGERLRGEAWFELWNSSYTCALEEAN